MFEIFSKTEIREWKKELEPLHPVHKPWVKMLEETNVKWEPAVDEMYMGSVDGRNVGPSSAMM